MHVHDSAPAHLSLARHGPRLQGRLCQTLLLPGNLSPPRLHLLSRRLQTPLQTLGARHPPLHLLPLRRHLGPLQASHASHGPLLTRPVRSPVSVTHQSQPRAMRTCPRRHLQILLCQAVVSGITPAPPRPAPAPWLRPPAPLGAPGPSAAPPSPPTPASRPPPPAETSPAAAAPGPANPPAAGKGAGDRFPNSQQARAEQQERRNPLLELQLRGPLAPAAAISASRSAMAALAASASR